MGDATRKEYYQRKAKKLRLPNAYTAALTDYMRKVELHTQVKDTEKGKVVIVHAYKKGFSGGHITAKHVDAKGITIQDFEPIHAHGGMLKFLRPHSGDLLLTATDDAGHTCTTMIRTVT